MTWRSQDVNIFSVESTLGQPLKGGETVAIGNFDAMMHQMNNLQAMQNARPPLAQTKPAAGSLFVSDGFRSDQSQPLDHGDKVVLTAQRDGFRGPVLRQQTFVSPHAHTADISEQKFFQRNADPTVTREAIQGVGRGYALLTLDSKTRAVDSATASGAENSALNLSQGWTNAKAAWRIYNTAAGAWDPKATPEIREGSQIVAQNLAALYDLDTNKLSSENPKIAGPERAKLQQNLMTELENATRGDCQVVSAQTAFRTAVQRFESNRNSVVIAAGNDNEVLSDFKKDAHGYTPSNIPKDFNTNFLATPEATMVGATQWFKGQNGSGPTERIASYSNRTGGIDLYASGSVDLLKDGNPAETQGTSYAAPRVAAMMASLHRANPNMSSAQIEHLMKTKFTHQLENGNSSVAVLDFHKYSDFMVGRRSPE